MDLIEEIENRICELQKNYVTLQEQNKSLKINFERALDDNILRIIDILDTIELIKGGSTDNQTTTNVDSVLIVNKIQKRLLEFLKKNQVQEITFKDSRVEVGKARVLETRTPQQDRPLGTILEICRKGYERGSKVIRPADVISS